MTDLSLKRLQQASQLRLPLFRSSTGGMAHSKPDGSDWSPAEWLAATLGELGEFARERHNFETGQLPRQAYLERAPKEIADVQIYMAALATRALDETKPRRQGDPGSPAEVLQEVVANLGEWANLNKKRQRGDLSAALVRATGDELLGRTIELLQALREDPFHLDSEPVTQAHPTGIDLATAVTAKYNEVSTRVGAPLYLEDGALIDLRSPNLSVKPALSEAVRRILQGAGADREAWTGYLEYHLREVEHVFLDAQSFVEFYNARDIDFIHDLKSGVFLAGFKGPHTATLSDLYRVHTGKPLGAAKDTFADAYVESGLGLLKSRAGTRVLTPPGFRASPALRALQRDFEEISAGPRL